MADGEEKEKKKEEKEKKKKERRGFITLLAPHLKSNQWSFSNGSFAIEHNHTPSGAGPNQNETTETTLRIEDWLKEVDIALWSHCMCVCVKMAVEQSNLFGLFIVLSCIRFSFRSFSRSCAISSLGSVSHFARPIGTERRRDNKLPWCGTIRLIWQRTGTPENTFTHHGWQMFYSFPLWFEFGRVLLDGKSKVLFPIYLHKLYTTAISNSLLHHLLIRLFISLENKT